MSKWHTIYYYINLSQYANVKLKKSMIMRSSETSMSSNFELISFI